MRDTSACDVEESFDICVEEFVSISICDFDRRLINPVYTSAIEDMINAFIFRRNGFDEFVAFLRRSYVEGKGIMVPFGA